MRCLTRMPEFGNAFRGLAAKRKLTHSELVRAIRFMVAAEYEAIQLYEQLAESIDNCLARKVLEDITHEEMEHVGEFKRLLKELAPEDEAYYHEGVAETEELIAQLGSSAEQCCHAQGESCCRNKQTGAENCSAAGDGSGEEGCCRHEAHGAGGDCKNQG